MIDQRADFIARLVRMKVEAGRLRLYRTMHALDGATKIVGWELAEHESLRLSEQKRLFIFLWQHCTGADEFEFWSAVGAQLIDYFDGGLQS